MVADAVVYHPALAHYLRFVATTGTYEVADGNFAMQSLDAF